MAARPGIAAGRLAVVDPPGSNSGKCNGVEMETPLSSSSVRAAMPDHARAPSHELMAVRRPRDGRRAAAASAAGHVAAGGAACPRHRGSGQRQSSGCFYFSACLCGRRRIGIQLALVSPKSRAAPASFQWFLVHFCSLCAPFCRQS